RYGYVQSLCEKVILKPAAQNKTISERIDEVLTHKFWGFLVFFALMGLIFQAIFTWSTIPMDLLSALVDGVGGWVSNHMPDNQLRSLIVDGVIAGVGGVVIFLPQIICLFFFIALFEDSGYMARAAFVLDRVMRKVGLNGKSFIPLLGSFACAVPAIMATRTIEDKNDRFATILVAPLMSCSARLPVYALMIAAFIPPIKVFGMFSLQGLTLFSMYFLSITAGLTMAAIFRKTLLKGSKTPFVLELPAYRMPNMRTVFLAMFEKATQFLIRAGTIIFTLSILLWFMVSYPRNEAKVAEFHQMQKTAAFAYSGPVLEAQLAELESAFKSVQIRESYAGKLGQWIEPVIRPLGYDWKIGIGLIASFAAREVLVSTLSIVYSVGGSNDSQTELISKLQSERSPSTGKPIYTPLVALSVMVFFVLACQCISTIAIVKRETNSWRWPTFMVAYMTVLAWTGAFAVFQIGSLLGY
nr:ferrous iron transport protein B [Candidatus Omnitrophota bacterium]